MSVISCRQEFSRQDPQQSPFLSATDGLGGQIRTRYIDYALQRFGGGIEDAAFHVETALTGDLDDDVQQDESVSSGGPSKRRQNKQAAAATTVIPPFKPDLAETKSVQKMVKAISDFVIFGVEKLHRI